MDELRAIKTTIPPQLLGLPRLRVHRCSLEVEEGPDRGRKLDPLGQRTIIGRDPWCDLVLSDPRISGQHCEIVLGNEEIRLRDLGSTNGTYCMGLHAVEVIVEPDLAIRIGDTKLRLQRGEGKRVLERSPFDPTGRLIGTTPAMQRLFDMMERVAQLQLSVILLGETGVGKTAVARAIHDTSPRTKQPFVSLNCGALPPELVESTLFGHVKGAFTGAHRNAAGIFEQADGGTVLLDEIGEMPLPLQPKLLHVLESRRVRPVGGQTEVEVDVRLIAATHRPLSQDVTDGRFRRDLYYRIAGLELTIPPLRERTADLPLLAQSMLTSYAEDAGRGSAGPQFLHGISEEAMRKLEAHSWPGNVRELDNVISRGVALAPGTLLGEEDILLTSWLPDGDPEEVVTTFSTSQSVEISQLLSAIDFDATFKTYKAAVLTHHESAYLVHLLRRAEGNQSRAARIAGISRTYLTTMLKKYGLDRKA